MSAIDAVEPMRVLAGAGLWRPGRLVQLLRAGRRHRRSLAAVLAGGPPSGLAVVDGDGPVTYPELDAMADACAANGATGASWPRRSGRPGLGVDVILLPPDLPLDRMAEVLRRERAAGLTADQLPEWLDTRLSRAERPREITVVAALRRTATGNRCGTGDRSSAGGQWVV